MVSILSACLCDFIYIVWILSVIAAALLTLGLSLKQLLSQLYLPQNNETSINNNKSSKTTIYKSPVVFEDNKPNENLLNAIIHANTSKKYFIQNNSHLQICAHISDKLITIMPGDSEKFTAVDGINSTDMLNYLTITPNNKKSLNYIVKQKNLIFDGVSINVDEYDDTKIIKITTDRFWNITINYKRDDKSKISAILLSGGEDRLKVGCLTSNISHILTPQACKINFRKNTKGTTSDGYSYEVEYISFNEVEVNIIKQDVNTCQSTVHHHYHEDNNKPVKVV
jgi:riboflavin synthase alpha subunit